MFNRSKFVVFLLLMIITLAFTACAKSEKLLMESNDSRTLEEGKYYEEFKFELNGRKYQYVKYCMKNNKIRIISMKTDSSELVIPSSMYGYPVIALGGNKDEVEGGKETESLKKGLHAWMIDEKQHLKKITISEGIKRLGDCSFTYIQAGQVIIPASMRKIGAKAFGFSKIKHVIMNGKGTTLKFSAFYKSSIKKIDMPEDFCGEIGTGCFEDSDIENFQWPTYSDEKWTSIMDNMGSAVFEGCKKLKKITFGANIERIFIPENTFYKCSSLKEIKFPETVKEVRYHETPYADNYRKGVEILIFEGENTKIVSWMYNANKDYITIGKIIAPKESEAMKFAKNASKIGHISKRMKRKIEKGHEPVGGYSEYQDTGDVTFVPMEWEEV